MEMEGFDINAVLRGTLLVFRNSGTLDNTLYFFKALTLFSVTIKTLGYPLIASNPEFS